MKVSQETAVQLARLILAIAQEEKAVEVTRQVLAEQPQFEPYAAFQLLDTQLHGYISSEDVYQFVRYHRSYECQ